MLLYGMSDVVVMDTSCVLWSGWSACYVVQCVEIEKDDVAGHTLLNKRLTKSV